MYIFLPDKSKKSLPDGSTALDACKAISLSLSKEAICAKVNGSLFDLTEKLPDGCTFEAITAKSPEALEILRHSAAHLMAQAIKHLYPTAQFAYGPATEEGFYYDVRFDHPLSENQDLPKIEQEMRKIVSQNEKIVREDVTAEEAKALFANQKYKLIHIDELSSQGESLSVYRQGDFVDLCLGPHMRSTGQIKAFKLMSTSSCYFKGDKNNDSLTRIYGTAFFSQKDLEDYLRILEERKESDHKKIGREMGLFMISDYGPGFPFWLPNGMILRHELEEFWWKLMVDNGYKVVKTPQILSRELWETSGHWREYKKNMYITKIDGKPFAIKPMNCPGAILVYGNDLHSYRDLPLRIAELGLVHRHEASGALNGLFRVRCFTQDASTMSIPSSAWSTTSSFRPVPWTSTSERSRPGTRPRRNSRPASRRTRFPMSSIPATAPSMARSWTSSSRIPSIASGNAEPSSLTCSFPVASTSPMSTRTARRRSRSCSIVPSSVP